MVQVLQYAYEHSFITLALVLVAWVVGGAIYRLYFSPLAKFPGPKLAAVTLWYEFYYDVVKRGRFAWEIGRMHDKYGPIVRINPYELHIRDSEHYEQRYTFGDKMDKYEWATKVFGNPSAVFATNSHELHRVRRNAVAPFFSKTAVNKLQSVIQDVIEKLCLRVRGFQKSGQPMPLSMAVVALTTDVISEYSFAHSFDMTESEDFTPGWRKTMVGVSELGHLIKQSWWIYQLMDSLPHWLVAKMNPSMMLLLNLRADMEKQVRMLIAGEADMSYKSHPTVFQELLESDLPEREKSVLRLTEEGQLIVGAGSETTAHTLEVAAYHILSNPDILAKLQAELNEALPNPTVPVSIGVAERLPYLGAVIQESLRLSYGVSGRLPRISRKETTYKDWVIPAGIPVGMSSIWTHWDPAIFPDPMKFDPERWTDKKERERLDRYLLSFSKGSRQCLGMSLAYAELYMTLATLFRRFEFDLYKTTRDDVELYHDFLIAVPKDPTDGVQVIVRRS